MTFLPDRITERDEFPDELDKDFGRATARARASTDALGISAASFAKAMSKAFADATTGGKKFDDVLRQLALRLSDVTVAQAFQPLARNLAGGLGDLFWRRFRRGYGHARPARARPRRDRPDGQVRRAHTVCSRRRDLNTGVLSAGTRRTRGCGRGRARSDFAACARTRWTTRSFDEWRACGAECHRAYRHAGRGQLSPLGGLYHGTDRARGGARTAELLKILPGRPERAALLFWACLRPLLAAQNKNPALLKGKSRPAQGLRSGPQL